MKKIILGVILTLYLVVAVFLTACLLTYNDYKISEMGDKSLIIVDNKDFEPNYQKGALLIVQKNKNDDIKINDEIFFYNTYKNQIVVSNSKVIGTEKITDTQTTYTISGNYAISSDYVIGKAETTKVINGVGTVLSFLESRWGFLLVIVLPISVLFIYEVYVIIRAVKEPEKEEKEEPKKDDDEPKKDDDEPKKDDDEPKKDNDEPAAEEEPKVEEKTEEPKEEEKTEEPKEEEKTEEPKEEEKKEEPKEEVAEEKKEESHEEPVEDKIEEPKEDTPEKPKEDTPEEPKEEKETE